MKIIDVPPPLSIKTKRFQAEKLIEEATEVHFLTWAENIIDFYSEGVKTLDQVRQVKVIVEAIAAANGSLTLELADYKLLEAAIRTYPAKVAPITARQYLPFIDAILGAQDVKK